MFGATDVIINWQPHINFRFIKSFFMVTRIGEAQEIPAATGKAVHSVSLALSRVATFWTLNIDEFRDVSQRTTAIAARFIALDFRQDHWQILFRHRHSAVFWT